MTSVIRDSMPVVARSAAFAELGPKIIEDVRNGVSIDDAAGAKGLDRTSVYRWQRRGLEAKARREALEAAAAAGEASDLEPVTGEDELYIGFAEDLVAARHSAKVEAETILRQHIVGYQEEDTTEVTELRPDPQTGQETMTVVKRTVRRRRRRSLTATLEWLARRYPKEYSSRVIAELTGADGAPLNLVEQANRIAEQAEAHLRARAAAPLEESLDAAEDAEAPPAG